MAAVWPNAKGNIVPHQSWLTIASMIYDKHGAVELKIYTDEAWVFKALESYNGVEGKQHGYYNFAKITPVQTPRLSSATALRQAVLDGDRQAFADAAGVDADTIIAGMGFFDLVEKYLREYVKETSLSNIVNEDPMNPTVGNYDLNTLQRKVARDFAQAADRMQSANSRNDWVEAIHQIKANTMSQVDDIIATYESLAAQRKKGGPNSRGIDKTRVESKNPGRSSK